MWYFFNLPRLKMLLSEGLIAWIDSDMQSIFNNLITRFHILKGAFLYQSNMWNLLLKYFFSHTKLQPLIHMMLYRRNVAIPHFTRSLVYNRDGHLLFIYTTHRIVSAQKISLKFLKNIMEHTIFNIVLFIVLDTPFYCGL